MRITLYREMPQNSTGSLLLLRLFDIAFQSRYSLPLLISVGFMVFDLNLQVSIIGNRAGVEVKLKLFLSLHFLNA